MSTQPNVGSKNVFVGLRLLGKVAEFFFWWLVILALVELAIGATVSLGSWFGPVTTIVAPLVALPIAILLTRTKPRRGGRLSDWTKQHELKAILLPIVAALLVAAIAMSPTIIEHRSRSQDAATALQSFLPIHESVVDHARLERTLAEFERARSSLANQWLMPDSTPRIALYLFRDMKQYKGYMATMGLDWSGGYAICREGGVTIGVPLEEASSILEESPATRTPLHEMVHATWCQKLGQESYRSIPKWFHEGMAKWYEGAGWRQFLDRALNRWAVWLSRASLMSATEFCGYTSGGSDTEIALLYRTWWEFIRSLETEHGIEALNAVIEDVGAEKDFDESLRARIGGTCAELYEDWSRSL